MDQETQQRLAADMALAQSGDRTAYAHLLHAITPVLLRYIHGRRRGIGKSDAEDLLQDILLSLHAVRNTYDPSRPFMPWLFAIAKHRMIDRDRMKFRRDANEILVDQIPETFHQPEANFLDKDLVDPDLLRTAIRQLPPGQREAIEMLKIREMSLKEASNASGMTIAALKVAAHRAIKSLRIAMGRGSKYGK